jgi:hypothetical protein
MTNKTEKIKEEFLKNFWEALEMSKKTNYPWLHHFNIHFEEIENLLKQQREEIIKIAERMKIDDEMKIYSEEEMELLKKLYSSNTDLKNYLVAVKTGANYIMDLFISKIKELK